jgi:hypothetical protein
MYPLIDSILDFIGRYAQPIGVIVPILMLLITWLSYRSRQPFLIKSQERHTDDIRKLLDIWLDQLTRVSARDPAETPSYPEPLPTIRLEVEDKDLFGDLSKHDKYNALQCWEEYKKRLSQYEKNHHDFLKIVYREFQERTSLSHDPDFKHGFGWDAIRAVYEGGIFENTIWKDKAHRLETMEGGTLLRMDGGGIARGSPEEIEHTKEVMTNMVLNIQSILGEQKFDEWIKWKVSLQVERRGLDEDLHELQKRIDNFKSRPLMTEPCKYIRRRHRYF